MKENSIEDIIEEKYTRYLNCETDILDLTLEEAKFILETDERRNYVTSILQEAGKVTLSDYKKILKENEELKEKIREHTLLISPYYVKENYIPVQKIEDTIEELKGKLEDISRRREKSKTKEEETVLWCLEIRTDERIKTLHELLENYKINHKTVKFIWKIE